MKRIPVLLLLAGLLGPALASDERMNALVAQGTSAYEYGEYQAALEHFSAAVVHASVHDRSMLYPASYLCAIWHFGRGVEASTSRARTACSLALGDMQRFQLDLFRQVLKENSSKAAEDEPVRIQADAAEALDWFLETTRTVEGDDTGFQRFPGTWLMVTATLAMHIAWSVRRQVHRLLQP